MIDPRDDLTLMEGYHSAQVEVDVRLNTNEAPEPPPPGFVDALADELRRVDWHRYPDRAYTALREAIAAHHSVDPAQVFAANGSNEVLQTLCLTYGGAGRTVAVFEPTYALHSHIARITGTGVATGERTEAMSLDLDEVHRVLRSGPPGDHLPLLAQQPHRHGGRRGDGARGARPALRACWWSTRPTGSSLPGRPSSSSATTCPWWSPAPTRRRGRWRRPASGYLIGPREVVARLDQVVLPYHLDALKQVAGRLALDHADAMRARVAALVEERGRLTARLADLPVTVWPSGANFVLFRPESADGAEVWKALVDRSVLVRDCSSWPRLDGCLRVTIGTPAEDDAFLTALEEALS